jgi:nucleotidyltransferase/DNA polymerase involved in DNA repair
MCADINKPNGKFRLVPDRQTIIEFVQKQPCRKVNGIGKVMDQMLKALGVNKVSDLFEQRLLLYRLFSADTFEFFMKYVCSSLFFDTPSV